MPTNIFNYDGTKLTTVPDGRIDTTSASIKFPGYGYINYGEAVNENMLWIMQNFASDSSPARPTIGQTWYDKTNEVLKVYDGTMWIEVGNVLKSSTPPTTTIAGILWYDTVNKQINVWGGTEWRLVGPLGSATNTDPQNPPVPDYSNIDTVLLSDGLVTHPVWRIMLGGTIVAIVSKDDAFVPTPSIPGGGFSSIKKGINFNSTLTNVGYYNDLGIWRNDQTNVPNMNGTYDLGSAGFGFNRIYAATFSGKADSAVSADVATAATSAAISSNSDQLGGYGPEKYLMTNRHALPDLDLTYDLGSPSRRWRDAYAGNVYTYGNLFINGSRIDAGNVSSVTGTANQITATGTKNIVLSTPQDIGTSSSVRFASVGLNQAPSVAGSVTFGDSTVQTTAWVPNTVYDLNVSPPAANINLAVGQRLVLKFTNFINIPLYTACQEGVYSVKLICTSTDSHNVDLQWFPNSVLTPVALADEFESTGVMTNTSSGVFSNTAYAVNTKILGGFWFDLVVGPADPVSDRGPFISEFLASTYTVAKMIKGSSTIALGASINNSMWLNGEGYGSGSTRLNTTTPWTSLGVIRLEPAASVGTYLSGTIMIERMA